MNNRYTTINYIIQYDNDVGDGDNDGNNNVFLILYYIPFYVSLYRCFVFNANRRLFLIVVYRRICWISNDTKVKISSRFSLYRNHIEDDLSTYLWTFSLQSC